MAFLLMSVMLQMFPTNVTILLSLQVRTAQQNRHIKKHRPGHRVAVETCIDKLRIMLFRQ